MKILDKNFIINYTLLISLSIFINSCNIISLKNFSNDYRWKNKKLEKSINLNFEYSPEVIAKIDNTFSYFFYKKDSTNIDKEFKIEKILTKKFKKRNILLKNNEENNFKLKIDTLFFQGYREVVSVNSNSSSNEYLGNSEKEYFFFKITGSLMKKDSCIAKIFIEKKHNTEPRESYLISGAIVDSGSNANSEKMIENTINEFSFRSYLMIKENMKKE
jgi:hypothetical protein